MRKNKECDFTVVESITHTLCEPHILQGIRGPHDCTGLPFREDKNTCRASMEQSQRKVWSIG